MYNMDPLQEFWEMGTTSDYKKKLSLEITKI